jgi:hypothetical protein
MVAAVKTSNLTTFFLSRRFLSPWWRRSYIPPKCGFLQEPHGVKSQKTTIPRSQRRENLNSYRDREMVAFLPWECAESKPLLSEHKMQNLLTFRGSQQAVSPLEMWLFAVPGHNNWEGGVLKTHVVATKDGNAVENVVWSHLLLYNVLSLGWDIH